MQAQHTRAIHFSINPMKRFTPILTATLLFLLLGIVNLYAQPVTFSVNMEHAFLQTGDQVVVRGNIPGLGNWEAPGQLTLKKERNSSVYSAKFNPKKTQNPILYKFVILRQDGSEEWEERGNRILNPENTEPVWFSDRTNPGIQQTVVQVTITLDLTEHSMNGLPTEGVALMGAHAPLSFELETGRTEMRQTGEGIWETTVVFPLGTQKDVPFKFAWKHEGEWIWEWRAGHTNHVFLIDDSSNEQTVSLRYDPMAPGVLPVAGTSGFVDNYNAILSHLGERGTQSRYVYEKAMQQLVSGQVEAANSTYASYKAAHPGGEEIDDFHYRMSYEIKKMQGIEAANTYIESRLAVETVPERQDYFRYLKGELALNAGDRATARRLFNQVRKEGAWEEATEYAAQGLVHSYLTESDPDSVLKGVTLLEQQAAQVVPSKRRNYIQRLARAYRAAEMDEKHQTALTELTTTGNAAQQNKAKLDLAKAYQRQGNYKEVLGLLNTINDAERIPKGLQVRIVRMRIEAYHELGMPNELATLFEQYQRQWPEDAYAKRLAKLNEQARTKLGANWNVSSGVEMETATPDSTNN